MDLSDILRRSVNSSQYDLKNGYSIFKYIYHLGCEVGGEYDFYDLRIKYDKAISAVNSLEKYLDEQIGIIKVNKKHKTYERT